MIIIIHINMIMMNMINIIKEIVLLVDFYNIILKILKSIHML